MSVSIKKTDRENLNFNVFSLQCASTEVLTKANKSVKLNGMRSGYQEKTSSSRLASSSAARINPRPLGCTPRMASTSVRMTPSSLGQMMSCTSRSKVSFQIFTRFATNLNLGEQFNDSAILDDYKIDKLLGEGGFGKVHLGINRETKKEVAIKFMDIRQIRKFHANVLV